MFDIGFTELVVIGVVSLLVIGPEKLPGAVRTVAAWVHRIRRGFNDIRREVEQELHNDAVLQELRKTGADVEAGARKMEQDLRGSIELEDRAATANDTPGAASDRTDPDPPQPEPRPSAAPEPRQDRQEPPSQ